MPTKINSSRYLKTKWPDWFLRLPLFPMTALAFVAGDFYLQQQARLPPLSILCLLLLCSLLIIFLCLQIKEQKYFARRLLGLVIPAAIAGFCWAGIVAHDRFGTPLANELEGKDLTVIGVIDNLPYQFERGVRFNLQVEQIVYPKNIVLPEHLALSAYTQPNNDAAEQDSLSSISLKPGQRWQFTVRLKKPHGNSNPYGFDYEQWLFAQGIGATGYVRPSNEKNSNQLLTPFVLRFDTAVHYLRDQLRANIDNALKDARYKGVITALVIGEQREIAQSDWQIFNRTGISHLVSISGLHITMIAGFFASILFYLWARSFGVKRWQLPLHIPAQKVAAVTAMLAALLYVLLSGFGVPSQRTLYMLSAVAVTVVTGRDARPFYVLSLALWVVVLLDPWSVLAPGFWLSFMAVALIFYAANQNTVIQKQETDFWQRCKNNLLSAAHVQYLITIGLVPLTMFLFAQISLISPIANAVAIPLISLIVTPLALIGSVLPESLASWVLQFAHALLLYLTEFLSYLSHFPHAVLAKPQPTAWMFVFALLGILWLLAPKGWPGRYLGLIALLPLLLNVPTRPAKNEWWVTAFDVGQGTAVLLETHTQRILYDTGAAYGQDSDAGLRVILPYLHGRGIDHLKTLIISHQDNDHVGGARSILENIAVDQVISSLPQDHALIPLLINRHQRCMADQIYQQQGTWNHLQWVMLQPYWVDYEIQKNTTNALSCTLRVTDGRYSMLLPGDIGIVQEKRMLANRLGSFKTNILLVPHHGSKTSSSEVFLDTIAPEIAIFQMGYRNRYHHPHPTVMARYVARGIQTLRSDEQGAVQLRIGENIKLENYREHYRRYWQRQ